MRNIELNQKLFNDTCEALPIRIFLWDHKAPTLHRVVEAVKSFQKPADGDGSKVEFRLVSGPAGVMAATNEAVERAELTMMAALFLAVGFLCYLTFPVLAGLAVHSAAPGVGVNSRQCGDGDA